MKKITSLFLAIITVVLLATPVFAKDNSEKYYKPMDLYYKELSDGTLAIVSGEYSRQKDIVIPEKINGKTVTKIAEDAFARAEIDNMQLKSIVIPDTVTTIEGCAFGQCTELEKVTFGKNIKKIGYGAFWGCSKLNKIELNKNIEYIDSDVFFATGVYLNPKNWIDNCLYIGNYLVATKPSKCKNCAGLRYCGKLNLKKGTVLIAKNVFKEAHLPKTITIPGSVKYINRGAFFDATSQNIILENGVKVIDHSNFTQIKEVPLKDGGYLPVTKNIKSITIPASVTKIENNAISSDVIKGYYSTAAQTYAKNYKLTKTKFVPLAVKSLAQVKNLKVTKTSYNAAALSWSLVPGAKYYRLEKSADGKKWTTAATVTTNSAKATALKAKTKYQFRVIALDETKKVKSKASAVLKVTTPEIQVLGVKATKVTKNAVSITWSATTGAKSYKVYIWNGKEWKSVAKVKGTACTVKSLKPGKTYQFKIAAFNSKNQKLGYASKTLKVTTPKK